MNTSQKGNNLSSLWNTKNWNYYCICVSSFTWIKFLDTFATFIWFVYRNGFHIINIFLLCLKLKRFIWKLWYSTLRQLYVGKSSSLYKVIWQLFKISINICIVYIATVCLTRHYAPQKARIGGWYYTSITLSCEWNL